MRKILSILTLILCSSSLYAQSKVGSLLCENRSNPVGLDMTQPRFSWQLISDKRNVMQTSYEIKVSGSLGAVSSGNIWKSGRVNSDQSVHVTYGGAPLMSGKTYFWQVRVWDNTGKASAWSQPASWQMGLLKTSDWKAKWIEAADQTGANPVFRKQFVNSGKVMQATAYVTSHGLYEASINGRRIGDAFLTPGWTSYNKRLQYQQYDVTSLLNGGANAIGVTLGNGWYRGNIGFSGQRNYYGSDLALLFQLDITYVDGKTISIVSDESWKSSTSAIQKSEIYHGEIQDARLEKTGWMLAGYDDARWSACAVKNNVTSNLVATYNEPVRKHETFKPLKIFKTPAGDQVIDFGQNLVGWVQVKATGNPGDQITIHHAEVLDKHGNFYTDNLRSAKQENVYILKGGKEEFFEPHFTFQGFRYIRVKGYPGEIKPEAFTAVALYSDITQTGTFSSSNALINQLQHNIHWGQLGNFLDVPTDCPQRDERLGWTGDAQAFSRTATFNFRVNNFFSKWLKDLALDQIDGSVPFVIPNVLGPNAAGSAGWADAATIIPWDMYLAYGDKRVLEDQFESMKNWIGYMDRNSTNHLWNKGFHFGDWLFYRPFDDNDGRSAVTDKYLIAQCFFAHSLDLTVKTAAVLGKADDAKRYADLRDQVKAAFMKEYVTPGGRLVSGTQTAYVLALNFDMLPESMRAGIAAKLAENVKSYGNHLTTGFLGTPYLCHVLNRFGYTEVAYTLLMQESYPSWLYPVKMGATTIWERWDGLRPDSTFQTPGMNSFNHYAYGAIGDWMYRVVCGIDTEEDHPGYKAIRIHPHPGGSLTYASADLETYYGKVSSHWKTEADKMVIDVEIPPNTTGSVFLPAASPGDITEGGKSLDLLKELKIKSSEGGQVIVQLGSGRYSFAIRKK